MKTTVDISDSLLKEVRRLARDEGTTLRSLIEEGLRTVLARRARADHYVMPDRSVGGEGLQPAMRGASWVEMRALAYGEKP